MRLLSLITFSLLSLLFACNSNQAPDKVKGVPTNAFWIGGKDGGSWYVIRSTDSISKSAVIEVYNDNSGELEQNKTFTLQCDNSEDIHWNNLESQISAFDGTLIHLNVVNGKNRVCYLK
jgi:hypothetical protein